MHVHLRQRPRASFAFSPAALTHLGLATIDRVNLAQPASRLDLCRIRAPCASSLGQTGYTLLPALLQVARSAGSPRASTLPQSLGGGPGRSAMRSATFFYNSVPAAPRPLSFRSLPPDSIPSRHVDHQRCLRHCVPREGRRLARPRVRRTVQRRPRARAPSAAQSRLGNPPAHDP